MFSEYLDKAMQHVHAAHTPLPVVDGMTLLEVGKPEIGDDWTDEEEMEWDSLLAQPHVQAGLNRLVKEAEQQIALGEIEEGDFL